LGTDVYGVAATLYTLLTGTPPIDALDRITQKGNTGVDPLKPVNHFVPSIPSSIAEAIHRAMALASDDRFPTMEAFWSALQPRSFSALTPLPVTPVPEVRASEPNKPVALLTTAMTSSNVQGQKLRPAKRRILLPLVTLLALTALLLGTLFGTSFFSKSKLFPSSASVGTVTTGKHSVSTPIAHPTTPSTVHPTSTPVPTPTAHAIPSPVAKQKPTPAPVYPSVNSQYVGGIHNTPGNIDGTMTLTNVHQSGPNIGGTMILTNGLTGTAAFTGTVTSNNALQFVVTPYTQYPPLLFQGHVNTDGSITGTYCSLQNNQCDYAAGGYGTWRVLPPSSSSLVPSDSNKQAA
jgi:hypothetical protein